MQGQHVLFIASVWPEPSSSAGGSRTVQLMKLFIANGWKITFASTAADSDHMINFSEWPVSKISILLNDSSFDEQLLQIQPTIVVFDKFMIEEQFGWRVAQYCPEALRILDTIDMHCLRIARHKALKENRIFESEDLLQEETAKREVASILRSDISLIISDLEMELLLSQFKIDKALLHYVPFLLKPLLQQDVQQWKSYEQRRHFVTIGNFLHEPNWNAVLYLKQEIWPLIKKQLPEAALLVYGAYCPPKAKALHSEKDQFLVRGRAENALEVMSDARICLAPLRFGAGIKGKLIEAMQCGTPSITTNIGAEGMHGKLPWNGSISDDKQEFATESVKLYSNKEQWQVCQKNGIRIINEVYPEEKLGTALIKQILDVQDNLKSHRIHNFMGSMLLHHRSASTRYLSKWIQEKNRKLSNQKMFP